MSAAAAEGDDEDDDDEEEESCPPSLPYTYSLIGTPLSKLSTRTPGVTSGSRGRGKLTLRHLRKLRLKRARCAALRVFRKRGKKEWVE